MSIALINALRRRHIAAQPPPGLDPAAFAMTVATTTPNQTFTFPMNSVGNTVNCVVDWGDGQQSTITAYNDPDLVHTYADAGDHQIVLLGQWTALSFNSSGDTVLAKSVEQIGVGYGTSWSGAVSGCTNLTTLNVSGWDTSACLSFNYFAYGCTNLTTLNVSGWDTSSCENFSNFVRGCTNLATLDISGWDTSACKYFSYFARGCTNLTTLDVSGWDTSACLSFTNFAFGCTNLTTLDVSGWDTSSCENFSNFAYGCALLQASVDSILIACDAGGKTGLTIDINGGTNATPSATGKAAADSLRAKGWTVNLNGY